MVEKEVKMINGIPLCDTIARAQIPTNLSQLQNDTNFITEEKVIELLDSYMEKVDLLLGDGF